MKAVDFFCGAGGVTCGLRMAGIDVLAGIDLESKCRETYVRNNSRAEEEQIVFINQDVSAMDPQDLQGFVPDLFQNDDEMLFIGCSPCQYYTNINTDKTKSAKTRTLLAEFERFVAHYRPAYIMIENVPGLQSNPESPLGRFQAFLRESGYVFDEKVVNAKYYGVPQNRRRYLLIATRLVAEGVSFRIPEEDRINVKTVSDAIGNKDSFPPIAAGHRDISVHQHSAASLSPKNLERIRLTEHDGGGRMAWAGIPRLQLPCYMHSSGYTDVYGRMAWNKPSPTITTRFTSISNGRYGHPEQDRAISIREGAALQSFPDDYVFYASNMASIARMIGNAVPPKLAESIGESLLHYHEQYLDRR